MSRNSKHQEQRQALRDITNKTPQLKTVITAQQARTPLGDITNKTPRLKTVRLNKDGYSDTPAVTKQPNNSKGTKNTLKNKVETRTVDLNEIKLEERNKIKHIEKEIDELKEEDDVPEIEYCPSPIKELPYEPLDEDLKFGWEALRHPSSITTYEFENIKYDELPFPEIEPDDYRTRKVIDDYELYGFDKVIFTDYELGDESTNEYETFQFKRAIISRK
ncbi:19597_t:CDS:2 [Cetraspora pellucida]|uniref:19597_t:CDS:1 n=1 Tax=Cetraspora pellucida TaxID=1433469 RepID=A0A9N8ZJW4_9GLOM|nr:19597_t:CDS:2 [Cetraspora pellucida]